MRKQTVDIIDSLVQMLTADVVINSVVTNSPGNYTVLTDCTWWLRPMETITIAGNDYKIESFVINVSLTITSVGAHVVPPVTSFPLAAPRYIHGTLKMAQNEVDAEVDKKKLCPFVYLYEVIRDRENTDEESMIDRETDLRIFFLNSVATDDWLTDEHYTYFVAPMQQMVDLFKKEIKKSKFFTENTRYDSLPLINVSENGEQEAGLFDCDLSGIELKLFAEIREDLSCENKCKCLT